MKYSHCLIPTLKETPQDAEILSHKLMLRAGLIRKLASGTYTYLPIGLKALQKCEAVIREEMNRVGALELLFPAIHPADLWKETGRFELMGDDMIHFEDRHGKQNVLGPTHEEIVTDLARREINSYKQLPLTLYQIQTKFRDEMRPRAGIIRSREFIMKDAYSFHLEEECLHRTYEVMKETYSRIFKRCGLEFFIVQADPGAMGGGASQEFVLFSSAGEGQVAQFGDSDHVVGADIAERKLRGNVPASQSSKAMEVHTPQVSTIEDVAEFLKLKTTDLAKTIFFEIEGSKLIAVMVRGDHEVSEFKVKKIYPSAKMAGRDLVQAVGSVIGYAGPLNLKGSVMFLIDEDVAFMKQIVIGANKKDYHLTGVNFAGIQSALENQLKIGDFRHAIEGDEAVHDGKTFPIRVKTAIELGHIFKLNLRYSQPMKAVVLDQSGKHRPMLMGCYGIGVNRIIAAGIEQSATEQGIQWPSLEVAPFQATLVTTNVQNEELMKASQIIYDDLLKRHIDTLWDDRDVSAGIKFNDADLLGLPVRIVLGPRGLKSNEAEIKNLHAATTSNIPLDQVGDYVEMLVSNLLSKTQNA